MIPEAQADEQATRQRLQPTPTEDRPAGHEDSGHAWSLEGEKFIAGYQHAGALPWLIFPRATQLRAWLRGDCAGISAVSPQTDNIEALGRRRHQPVGTQESARDLD